MYYPNVRKESISSLLLLETSVESMGKEAALTYGFNLKCLNPCKFPEVNILMVSDQIK